MILAGAFILAGSATDAKADEVTLATLAPKKSAWGKVFSVWAKAVKKKTKGKLKIKWYYNGAQGDESAVVSKMRSGQLDGGAVTSVGMSKAYKNILVLQSPGLFKDWATLDKARNAMKSDFQSGANANGFHILGWGDVGVARTMSKGKAIRSPGDLKNMKVYRWTADPVGPVIGSVIGYTGVPKSVPGLLPALSSGQVNVITVPCLAAVNLQWHSHLDHINDAATGYAIGGMLIKKDRLDNLPADMRKLLKKTGKKAGKMLTKRIRKEDKKAFKLLKKRMTVVKLNPSEKARWKSVFKKIRGRVGQQVFTPALMCKVEKLAGASKSSCN